MRAADLPDMNCWLCMVAGARSGTLTYLCPRAVAAGAMRAADLPDALRLAGGTVQPVSRTVDGETFVGSARLALADLPAANGLVHVLDGALVGDVAVNGTAIALAERLGDFGPFNSSQARLSAPEWLCPPAVPCCAGDRLGVSRGSLQNMRRLK